MTASNYQDYGLNPDEDFAAGLSIHRKMLNLIKYYRNGFMPHLDSRFINAFDKEEKSYIQNMKRGTVNGVYFLHIYAAVARTYLKHNCTYGGSIVERYRPIIIRVFRDKIRKACNYESLSDIRYEMALLNQIANRFVDLIDKKYNLPEPTLRALYNRDCELILLQETADRAEREKCSICGALHNNKKSVYYFRDNSNRIRIGESAFDGKNVLPYCKDCGEIYTRKKAKEDFKADKALNEAKEIGKLLRSINQEIKANGKQN